MSVTHIVIFQLKPESTPEYVASVIRDMMALEQKCVKPDTKKPYIVSLKGGKQMSIEQTYSVCLPVYSAPR